MKQILTVSYLLLLFLHIFDTYSTYHLLTIGGAEEANPFMEYFMSIAGKLPAMIIIKLIFFALLLWAYIWALKKKAANILLRKEYIAVYGITFILIGYYLYFMYTRNLQYLLAVNS